MSSYRTHTTLWNEPKVGRKYFAIAEANSALPYVSRVVDDISAAYERAVDVRQRIEHPNSDDCVDQLREDYELLMDQLNEFIDELALVGVELKDFERGLIDFPSLYQGREIYLCWQRGEPGIEAWHEIDAGFAGRQDVAELEEQGV